MPFSSHHWMAICRSSTCLNRFQASHKLYSVSRRLNRRNAPAPRMPSWKSFRNRASFSVSEKRSMMAHSWTSNLSGSVRYRLPSCSWMLRASLTASRSQSGNSSMTVCRSSARSNSSSRTSNRALPEKREGAPRGPFSETPEVDYAASLRRRISAPPATIIPVTMVATAEAPVWGSAG